MALKGRAWNWNCSAVTFKRTSTCGGSEKINTNSWRIQVCLGVCVCLKKKTHMLIWYRCVCVSHKSSVRMEAGDATISGAAWSGWQQLRSPNGTICFHNAALSDEKRKYFSPGKEEDAEGEEAAVVRSGWFWASVSCLQNIRRGSVLLFACQPGGFRDGDQGHHAERCN